MSCPAAGTRPELAESSVPSRSYAGYKAYDCSQSLTGRTTGAIRFVDQVGFPQPRRALQSQAMLSRAVPRNGRGRAALLLLGAVGEMKTHAVGGTRLLQAGARRVPSRNGAAPPAIVGHRLPGGKERCAPSSIAWAALRHHGQHGMTGVAQQSDRPSDQRGSGNRSAAPR